MQNNNGRLVAWLVIIGSVVASQLNAWVQSKVAATAANAAVAAVVSVSLPTPTIQDSARYTIGIHLLMPGSNPPTMLATDFKASAKTPVDHLAAVAVIGELEGKNAALDRLDMLRPKLPAELVAQEKTLTKIYQGKPAELSNDDRKSLREQLGWLGDLALTFGLPSDNPSRAEVLFAARKTTIIKIVSAVSAYLSFVTGTFLFVVLVMRLARRRFQTLYRPPAGNGASLMQAFAIYLGGITAAAFVLPLLPAEVSSSIILRLSLMLAAATAAVFWPALRGDSNWREAMGWTAGTGVIRELGMGLGGYLAGLPLLAVGFAITVKLSEMVNKPITHPVEHMLTGGNRLTEFLGVFLACVYAPIVEETMFRGLFFAGMRARHRWLVSSLVVSILFAVVHPQAWTAIPALCAVAIVLAGIREWRGTILSSTAAHCLHNTILVSLTLLM